MRGAKAQPTHLKALLGNPGKRALRTDEPTPPSSATVPECPDWLDDYARGLWEQQAPISHALGTLTTADIPAFAAWCESWSLYRRASLDLADEFTHDTPNNGESVKPAVTVRKQALADWTRLGAELGFSPAARTRIQAHPPNAHRDPVQDFKSQRPVRPA